MTATLERQPKHCEVIEGLVDTKTVARMFGKSNLTIMVWRQERDMPYVLIPGDRNAIRYRVDRLKAWAKRLKIEVAWDPEG